MGSEMCIRDRHKRNVEQAGFVILKSPEIPSLLIETGYISNPSEARKLATKRHQKKIAQAIFRGARQYMKDNPPLGSLLAWQRDDGGERLTTYVIVRGDTLSEIASRYRVSSDNIKRINGLRSDKIRIGQVLKIPAS